MTAPTLTTPHLTLRAATLADFEPYAAMWADPRVTNFIGGEPRDRTTSWGKFLAMPGLWALLGYGFWVWQERETGALAGVGGLARFERGIAGLEGYPEAGWALTADHWGRGYATEAMGAVLAWADNRDLGEIRCIIDEGNAASVGVARKLGFRQLSGIVYARIAAPGPSSGASAPRE